MVALGGAVGASLRYGSGLFWLRVAGSGFPYGTLFVNVVGSALMGLLAFYLMGKNQSDSLRFFLLNGLLGGFTTFSTFSMDTFQLWQQGKHELAGLYILLSFVLSLGGLFIGYKIAKAWL